jgi:hypothetical protein
MPALADPAPGTDDLSTVEVDGEVIAAEVFVPAVPAGGVARQRLVNDDLLLALGSFRVERGGVAAVDPRGEPA